MESIRLDASKAVRTDEGFLRVPARITRTGILEYHRGGQVVRELRRPDQVFAPESIESLKGVPLTIHHPAKRYVTAKDVAAHAVGYVGQDVVRVDDRYLEATLTIWRSDAVSAVEAKKLTEISAGYRAGSGPGGEYAGQRFDIEQTGIRYNHAALLPPGHGRGGSELAIRLDEHDLITLLRTRLDSLGMADDALAEALGLPDAAGVRLLLDGHLGTPDVALLTRAANVIHVPVDELISLAPRAPKPSPTVPKMKRSITVNGVAFPVELSDDLAPAFDSATAAEAKTRTDAADKSAADATKLADVTKERDELKTRCDALEADAKRVELEAVTAQAKAVHKDAKGDTVRDVQVSTLKALGHDVRTDASDDKVAGLFEMAIAAAAKKTPPKTPAPDPLVHTDADDKNSAAAARERMRERNANAWRDGKDADKN